jgi:hypothetical protein
MGTHHYRDRVPASTPLGHGIIGNRSQDVYGFGVRVHHTSHQALQEWKDSAQGHRSRPNDS